MSTIDPIDPASARIRWVDEPSVRDAVRRRTPAADASTTRRIESGQASGSELITERTTTDVSLRMDMFGLEYRKLQTIERHYTKSEQKAAARRTEKTDVPDQQENGVTLDADVIEPQTPPATLTQRRIVRAYLPNPDQNDPLTFQA